MLNASSAFQIGSTHQICQDYACHFLLGENGEGGGGAIVSDGCSSSPKTDVGARILGEVFSRIARCLSNQEMVGNATAIAGSYLRDAQRTLDLPSCCFDATLVAAVAKPKENTLLLAFWGDGAAYITHTEGEPTWLHIDYNENQNAPYYASHELLRSNGKTLYREAFGEPNPIRIWESQTIKRPEGLDSNFPVFEIPLEGISQISVFSDGISSFLKDGEQVDAKDIAAHLCDFKSTEGAFCSRRLQKCRKLWAKDGIQHADDLGIGALLLQP